MKQKTKLRKPGGLGARVFRRFLLVVFTVVGLVVTALVLVLNLIFNGPSPTARSQLTMALIEASATKWVPALFIGQEGVDQIRISSGTPLTEEVTNVSAVIIRREDPQTDDEWADYPDGIRIEQLQGGTYTACVMLVRDPSRVYLGISTDKGFSSAIPGKRLNVAIEDEGAIAAVNGGAFADPDDSLPLGLVYSEGECRWTSGRPTETSGFAGFNQDDVLVVHRDNMTKAQAEELDIRDGCCFGPALIINGEVNQEAYTAASGLNPRTAIGQRADGVVIFVCINGRQAGSMGGTYADVTDIMVEYGAVNACNLDGGSSTVMLYRDTYGLYGEPGQVQMMNTYSLMQLEPRRMPDFWLVRGN